MFEMKGLQYMLPCLLLVVSSSSQRYDDPYQRVKPREEKQGYGAKKETKEYKYYYGGIFEGKCFYAKKNGGWLWPL